jgi:hypothetical protein
LRSEEYIVMGAQILKWSNPHFNSEPLRPRRIAVSLDAERTICPFCGEHRGPSVTYTLKHGAVVLGMVITLLAALALFTGIFIAALKYAANAANRTFYEMHYSHVPPTET